MEANTLDPALTPVQPIRPEVQALIDRGYVEISEVEHLGCTLAESDALIPAYTNNSLARRLDRVLSNIKLAPLPEDGDKWALYNAGLRARKYLEHNKQNLSVKAEILEALSKFYVPARPTTSYLDALYVLAAEASKRL